LILEKHITEYLTKREQFKNAIPNHILFVRQGFMINGSKNYAMDDQSSRWIMPHNLWPILWGLQILDISDSFGSFCRQFAAQS